MKLYLRKIRLNSGGYDSLQIYWGVGAPLYEYFDEDSDTHGHVRASTRDAAKHHIRAYFPNVEFYR